MDHLLRDLAPISDSAWKAIEVEAKARLTTFLAARKLVDFDGPHGWEHQAIPTGRVTTISPPGEGVAARQRQVLPLVELRAQFRLSRAELEDVERGRDDVDFGQLDTAAHRIALAENVAVLHGYGPAQITGITEASSHEPIPLGDSMERYPTSVSMALDRLRQAGIDGPYGLAIGPAGYAGIVETTEHGGYLLFDHLRRILDGPLVWAPGVEGAVVVSLRGGDFLLTCGQDLSVGYLSHTAEEVTLYLEESLSFRVLEPDAAVALR
ncbi:MAG: bacteriocin family protein [Acidimicrobiales bacterium]|nr:bacteriocin family protein [Acidimicrobiales bacterium]